MASGYTTNYGLCQWQGSDKFLREEFNQDNAKLDAAVAAASSQASKALSGLEDQSYNIYNLILQNDYAGRYTGWKKGMVFDGFLDGSGIAQMSDGILLTGGTITLSGSGQEDVSLGYGSAKDHEYTTAVVTASGSGTLTGITCKIYSEMYVDRSIDVSYTVKVNGGSRLSGTVNSGTVPGGGSAEKKLIFSSGTEVRKGDTITVTLSLDGSAWYFQSSSSGSALGGTLHFTPMQGLTGQLTTVEYPLPACGGMRAWTRCQGGNVTLSLLIGGNVCPFAAVEQRETAEPRNGAACTETEYQLDQAVEAGDLAFRLDLEVGSEGQLTLYDYGVILL